ISVDAHRFVSGSTNSWQTSNHTLRVWDIAGNAPPILLEDRSHWARIAFSRTGSVPSLTPDIRRWFGTKQVANSLWLSSRCRPVVLRMARQSHRPQAKPWSGLPFFTGSTKHLEARTLSFKS